MEVVIPDEIYEQMTVLTQKIYDLPFAAGFRKEVDPANETYDNTIEKPMHISAIIEKLENKDYKKVKDWKDDMQLVFKNSMKFNQPLSPLYIYAEYILSYFNDKADCIPNTASEKEKCIILKLTKKLNNLINSRPLIKSKKTTKPSVNN